MPVSLALLMAAAPMASSPMLGLAEGSCRHPEPGPAILITAVGLKDRTGELRAELDPPTQSDFLADDNSLIEQGKVFRRAVADIPAFGPAHICIRVPKPGTYAQVLTHDRDHSPKFDFWRDGVGFAGNPHLGHAAPPVEGARIRAGNGITKASIILNYRKGLFRFGPNP